ncbi:MAG: PAS domain S-box protein [Nitrospiraceae bacterium]
MTPSHSPKPAVTPAPSGFASAHSATTPTAAAAFERVVGAIKDFSIYLLDADGVVQTWNEGARRIEGYEAEEIIGRHFSIFFREEDRRAGAPAALLSRARAEERAEDDGWRVRKDGTHFFAEVVITALRDNAGQTTGFVKVIRDRTEQNRLHEQFRLAVEAAPSGMVLTDEVGTIHLVNAQVEHMFGYERSELIGRSVDLLTPTEVRGRHAAERAQFVRTPQARAMGQGRTLYGRRKDGLQFPVEIGLNPIHTHEGMRVLAAIVDVTERTRLEERLRRTERMAELGTVASGMAHEIGTPMNVILGRAEYLLQRARDESARKGLQTIVTQVERITKVMQQLLAFARRRAPERRAVDLRQTLRDSLEMFQERFAQREVRLVDELDAPLPPVQADPDHMTQVFINLIMNSLQAMPEGGTLRVRTEAGPRTVTVSLSDSGAGIPAEALGKIFEPFFTTKDAGEGTGLGLTVVKGIVDEHEGTIAVTSTEGRGTTVTLSLPCETS